MNDKPETLTFRVIETVESVIEIEVTDELLDRAAERGFARTDIGVIDMIHDDPDHAEVADAAANPENFTAVIDRDAWLA